MAIVYYYKKGGKIYFLSSEEFKKYKDEVELYVEKKEAYYRLRDSSIKLENIEKIITPENPFSNRNVNLIKLVNKQEITLYYLKFDKFEEVRFYISGLRTLIKDIDGDLIQKKMVCEGL